VVVITRDVWTLDPDFGFGRSGGANRTHLDLQETNSRPARTSPSRAGALTAAPVAAGTETPIRGSHARARPWYATTATGA
jgi:hypothetical protein